MTRRRQVGSGSGVEEEAKAGRRRGGRCPDEEGGCPRLAWMRRRWGTEAAGQRRGGGAAASGEERGRGSRARGEGEGIGVGPGGSMDGGGTILMAHHTSVRHKYIHTNGAPHPGAPLVFFFHFCSSQQVIFHLT